MNTPSIDPGMVKGIVLLLALAVEIIGIGLTLVSLRQLNPRNPLRLTWRMAEWEPLHRQRDHFRGNGFGLYKNGINLFILGAAVHLASLLFLR